MDNISKRDYFAIEFAKELLKEEMMDASARDSGIEGFNDIRRRIERTSIKYADGLVKALEG